MPEWMLVVVTLASLAVAGGAVLVATRAAATRTGDGDVHRRLEGLDERLSAGLVDDRRRVEELGRQVAELGGSIGQGVEALDRRFGSFSAMFSDHRARGAWGEVHLARVLDQAGLVEGRDYHTQAPSGVGRVDVAIPVGDRQVVVDAKFPVARLAEAAAAEGEDRQRLLREAGGILEATARSLAGKGYGSGVGDRVVMFVPNEGLLAQVMEADPGLHERVLALGVLPVGPAGLAGLLGVIGSVLVERRTVERADAIVGDARELVGRLATWADHFAKVGAALGAAVGAYNRSVGSWQARVEPQGRRVVDGLGSGTDLGLASVEEAPRVDAVA